MPPPARRSGEHELAEGIRLLDRYTILDRIGSGGMATIYRATDTRLDRVVCVKLLRTTLVEGSGSTSGNAVYEATYAHFLKEALALSKLQHPNTLRIYDFGYLGGTDKGAPFHVSEYLDGGNLETHLRMRGPLPGEEAVGILESVSGAIAEAHDHGIIHRDIKPSNILFANVRGELVPKLADFGIAHSDLKKKKDQGDKGESVSTVALFSPRWAAPEQLCGSPEGPRTDVYAMGLLIVFMLSGSVLFGDDDVRITFNDRVRGDTLVTARLGQLGFGGDVKNVLLRSMTARPDDRIATAPELYEKIREALRVRTSHSVAPFPAEPRSSPPQSGGAGGPAAAAPAIPPSPAVPLPPPPPQPRGMLALEVEGGGAGPIERVVAEGARRVRYVQVHEKLDLAFADDEGGQVRVRVTMLPGAASSTTLNIKGLSCFVARRGGRPTPATSVSQDGSLELVSSSRQVLGEITWSFGQASPQGRVFVVDGRQLLVPYSEAQQAVVVTLSHGSDLVVMCRR